MFTRSPQVIRVLLNLALVVTAPWAAAFDRNDLAGFWAESNKSHFACTSTNLYQRFELSPDEKHLTLHIQEGPKSHKTKPVELDVIRSDEHSLYLRFVGRTDPGDPMAGEWALTILGPGVYRWHLASEHEGLKPAPIGVRCAP
jgi:hypothetical protein